jgi:CheY-like chemotaxis protein
MKNNPQTRILCIDDDRTGLLIRKMMLEAEGYQVVTASSGQEGLAALKTAPVNAIILDYQMPSMNGASNGRICPSSCSRASPTKCPMTPSKW